jgi:hypothetical protein
MDVTVTYCKYLNLPKEKPPFFEVIAWKLQVYQVSPI